MPATDLKRQLKEMIVESLNLEGMDPATIGDDQALFGAGLELDSLDALQLAVAVEERFGVAVADRERAQEIFASVDALARFVEISRQEG